jgi:hypothetical protein
MPSWDDVVTAGLRLPGVQVGASYHRSPALKVNGKGMCRLRVEEDPGVLAIRVIDLGEREALLQSGDPAFFTTPHYDGYPYVLVRLALVDPVILDELVQDAWRTMAPKRLVARHDAEAGA